MFKQFNEGWEFSNDEGVTYAPVCIPHDWLIYDVRNLYKSGMGFYKKVFTLDSQSVSLSDEQRVFIRFDGVMMDSALFVNNRKVGEWKCGYTAFEFDITEYLSADSENTMLLSVNYRSPSSRWYTGAGIYRDVFLIVKNSVHFVSDGIYVTSRKVSDRQWEVDIEAEVEIASKSELISKLKSNMDDFKIRHTIVETNDVTEVKGEAKIGKLTVNDARLWDIIDPHLYHLKSELIVNGGITDTVITRFGLRETAFDSAKGFFLNGRRVRLNGACQHHDLGALGAEVSRGAMRRQLNILRNMGVNAIRTAHNPPAWAFMELADEMGFLVVSEILDMWKLPKTQYDYARFFDEWIERDVASWVRRDRNCPSVIMWSVGNEIYDTHASYEEGAETLRMLSELVKKHDPNGHAAVTLCSNYMHWENTQRCVDIIKLIGYNYAEDLYHEHHEKHPDWVIYGGETGSLVQSRGVYHFPLSKEVLHDDDMQCSALGNSQTSWGAQSVEKCITDDRDADFSLGQFLWAGFDYIGEPTPYHTKNSYFGQVDTAGFPKDSYYIFKSAWTDYKTEPFVHVFPYWDFSPGQIIDVRLCTNAPKAELFFNDSSIGVFEVDHKKDKKIVGDFQIPYEPGKLTAIAYDDTGVEVARAIRCSFGDAVSFDIRSETVGELVFYEITALDKDGNVVENANNRLDVTVTGGELLGLDNGDSTDYDQYKTDNRRMFNGKLLAIVKPDETDVVSFEVNQNADEMPVRKVELLTDGFKITAKVYPHNASYDDFVWRLTDASGITSSLGTLEVADDGRSAILVPTGDGEVYVRCGVKNGGESISLYAQIEYDITGYGKSLLNPYDFVTGGLYSLSNVELSNGNERGVATLRTGESHVGFSNIDFGAFGSDEVTLSLFPLSKENFEFEIWIGGLPGKGGELLSTCFYDKGSNWNEYIKVTYSLPKRLSGIETICFVFDLKVHIGGFVFKKSSKAFAKLYATDNDFVYGDSYTIAQHAIEGIGNNVTIGFNGMDFGDEGATEIEMSLRCDRKNSFQILATDSSGKITSNMLEVEASKDYSAVSFAFDKKIAGENTVSFVFLPGCDIDIEWFRFKE